MAEHQDENTTVRIVTIITLGVLVGLSIVSITVVALLTDRDILAPEILTFCAVLILAALGGVAWYRLRLSPPTMTVERDDSSDRPPHE